MKVIIVYSLVVSYQTLNPKPQTLVIVHRLVVTVRFQPSYQESSRQLKVSLTAFGASFLTQFGVLGFRVIVD